MLAMERGHTQASDVEAEVARRDGQRQRDEAATRRAKIEAEVLEERAHAQRLEAETQRLEELCAEKVAVEKTVGELSAVFTKRRAEAQLAWDQLSATQIALTSLAGRIAAATQRIKALSPEPPDPLRNLRTPEDIKRVIDQIEYDERGTCSFDPGGYPIAAKCRAMLEAVVRAKNRLSADERREIDQYISERELARGTRVERQ